MPDQINQLHWIHADIKRPSSEGMPWLSQEQLADKIGVDPKHLSRIEVGRGYPSLEALENIAKVLNVEMKCFFEFQHLDSADVIAKSVDMLVKAATEKDKLVLLKLLRALLL